MQAQRHRVVSKSTAVREDLSSVWRLQSGKFDDGIDEIQPAAKPEKHGPRIRSLMGLLGIKEEDFDKNICIKCGKEHEYKRRYCETCQQERIDNGLSIRH